MRYFKKSSPKIVPLGSYGQQIVFPDFGNGYGGIATDNEKQIHEFELLMRKNVGGISEVTEAEFENLKKKPQSSPHSNGEQVVNDLLSLMKRQGAAAANPQGAARAATGKRANDLVMPNNESLLMPSEPAKATGFRPKSISSR